MERSINVTFLFEVFVFINFSNSKLSVVLLRCTLNPGAVCNRRVTNATDGVDHDEDNDDDDDDDGDDDIDEVDGPLNS